MSIRLKVLLPTILSTLLTTVIILIVCYSTFSGYVDETVSENLDSASVVLQSYIDDRTDMAEHRSRALSMNDELIDALVSGDRAAIVKVSQALQKSTDVEFITIVDPEGTVIVRSHEPDNYGDVLANQENIKSAIAGTQKTGIETGSAVKLSIRSGTPIYYNGKLIAAVSTGFRMDENTMVDAVKALTSTEVTIFLGDTRIATTVTNASGGRATGTQATEAVSKQVLGGTAYEGATQILGRNATTKYTPLRNASGTVIGMLFVGSYTDSAEATIRQFLLVGIIVGLVLVIFASIISLYIATKLSKSIKSIVEAANDLALGDVSIRVESTSKDETSELVSAFNNMIDATRNQAEVINTMASGDYSVDIEPRSDRDMVGMALKKMIDNNSDAFSQIMQASAQVSGGSTQLAEGANALATGSTEQAAAVQQLSASISDIFRQSEDNTSHASEAFEDAQLAGNHMREAMDSMNRMINAMQEINAASDAISKVISVIDNIAFQTNILSLNASVEAARAGQHGKGFAVVAEEVRSLATQSAQAAKETEELIQNSINRVSEGSSIASQTSGSLDTVAEISERNAAALRAISEASQRQCDAIAEINQGIEQISTVVQSNSATAQESAAASHEMSNQAQMLEEIVNRFSLRDEYKLAGKQRQGLDSRY